MKIAGFEGGWHSAKSARPPPRLVFGPDNGGVVRVPTKFTKHSEDDSLRDRLLVREPVLAQAGRDVGERRIQRHGAAKHDLRASPELSSSGGGLFSRGEPDSWHGSWWGGVAGRSRDVWNRKAQSARLTPSRLRSVGFAAVSRSRRELAHRPPQLSASNSRRTSSSEMSADQPYVAATAASRAVTSRTKATRVGIHINKIWLTFIKDRLKNMSHPATMRCASQRTTADFVPKL